MPQRYHRTPLFLDLMEGYSAKEDSWVPEWDLKNSKATLADYKKLHPSIFSPSQLPTNKLSLKHLNMSSIHSSSSHPSLLISLSSTLLSPTPSLIFIQFL